MVFIGLRYTGAGAHIVLDRLLKHLVVVLCLLLASGAKTLFVLVRRELSLFLVCHPFPKSSTRSPCAVSVRVELDRRIEAPNCQHAIEQRFASKDSQPDKSCGLYHDFGRARCSCRSLERRPYPPPLNPHPRGSPKRGPQGHLSWL